MKTLIVIVVIIVLGVGAYFLFINMPSSNTTEETGNQAVNTATSSAENEINNNPGESVIGKSVENRDIVAQHFGTGEKEILLIGGIHGGYEWNTVALAYQAADYLKENPSVIPANVKVTIIPVLNPDGLYKVASTSGRVTSADVPKLLADTVVGRFNANTVDLNRNFDCDWQASGKWQSRTVSGGSTVFSEPESQALKSYIEAHKPTAVVIWFSAAGGVYASNCHNGILAETRAIMTAYASASSYPADDNFDFYSTTGSMANWLAKNNIPAISVILSTHTDSEWAKNQKGLDALLKHYAN